MIALQEVYTVDYSIDIDKIIPEFSEKFKEKIQIFRISITYDFEIDLKKEFQNNNDIKKEIKSFIKKHCKEIKVFFINNQLPF